jgi:hypothetical protein
MPTRRWIISLGYSLLILLISLMLLVGCNTEDAQPVNTIQTKLLVRAPDGSLPVGRPITVKSQTQDVENGVSHVELYVVKFTPPANEAASPGEETNLLVRSDAAPFDQTTFTADQTFIPARPGDYVIKVVGYNKLGNSIESEYISFRAENPNP